MKWPLRRRPPWDLENEGGGFLPSRTYGFVRGRELEGTYPGPPNVGSWILTTQRISKGWGSLPNRFWPYDPADWPPVEPPGLDTVAKAARTRCYMRCRTLEECRKVLEGGGMVLAAFEIDDSWSASEGLIDDPRLHSPQASHSIVLVDFDPVEETIGFTHNWGPAWGENGFGRLPYRYWSDRLLEAWIPDERQAATVEPSRAYEFIVIKREAPDPWGHTIHLIEVEDRPRDEMMAWAMMRHSSAGLELEEIFVRPTFRGRGHGRRLADAIIELHDTLDGPLSAWIAHADAAPTAAQDAILRRLGLGRVPSDERWAAARALP
ncbi:MAG TPA: GNAT family N-acetyltransferase [Solirubrobacterales bacterium]|nr:GNAT family N-acetyltransferase [Solirubrobacterales bacterium]